jgi:hypothetical protein
MSRLIGLAVTAVIVLASFIDSGREKFTHYKAVEAYEIRPGILMMPRYSSEGQICEIVLEKRHYSPEVVRLDSDLSYKEIDQIFAELVPPDERGPRAKGFERGDLIELGHSLTITAEFEKVSIQIVSKELSARRHTINVENVVAVVRWKNRTCQ